MRSLTAAVLLVFSWMFVPSLLCQVAGAAQAALGHRSAAVLTVDGLQFKDLNRNGKLDGYEDWRQSPEARADDLLRQMSLEDMAGTMVHGTLPSVGGPYPSLGMGSGGYNRAAIEDLVGNRRITTFITRLSGSPGTLAEENNKVQETAERMGLGVPVTISTDPRNSFQYTAGASVQTGQFSKWPETTGLAAIGDVALVRQFADTVRQEYEAVGMREALSPQADLATEPRWTRLNGTFGEDAETARAMVEAYVEGIQGGKAGLNAGSVAAVVKHWVGYGAQKDGMDSHNFYGRYSELTDAHLAYHVTPFLGAFEAHVAMVMPTYSILEKLSVNGTRVEPMGAAFNKELLSGLLRGKYGFQGVVLSDWAIMNDCDHLCEAGMPAGQPAGVDQVATPWGVQALSKEERFAKSINAGVDQIGGTNEPRYVLEAVKDGKLGTDRVKEATRRVLVQKFAMGLFENPYVDAAAADGIVGKREFVQAGEDAQKRAMVLLENKGHLLPLKPRMKVYLFGVNAAAARSQGFVVVDTPELADVAVIRAQTPFETLHPNYFFGARQHEGRLNFKAGDAAYDALLRCGKTPVVMTVYLDRPAILTEVKDKASALLGNFGIGDEALFDVLSGKAQPEGKLPFELPSSMEAVAGQQSDMPHDSVRPLYRYGFGLRY